MLELRQCNVHQHVISCNMTHLLLIRLCTLNDIIISTSYIMWLPVREQLKTFIVKYSWISFTVGDKFWEWLLLLILYIILKGGGSNIAERSSVLAGGKMSTPSRLTKSRLAALYPGHVATRLRRNHPAVVPVGRRTVTHTQEGEAGLQLTANSSYSPVNLQLLDQNYPDMMN